MLGADNALANKWWWQSKIYQFSWEIQPAKTHKTAVFNYLPATQQYD